MAEPVRPDGTAALWDVNATVDGVLYLQIYIDDTNGVAPRDILPIPALVQGILAGFKSTRT